IKCMTALCWGKKKSTLLSCSIDNIPFLKRYVKAKIFLPPCIFSNMDCWGQGGFLFMENKNIEQGKRINGKRANAERYIPFYEFLLFDPLYRKMNEKGKILYTYLRNKVKYFEHENERYEQGEGTKSYLDDEGNTFIIADNTELCYILNCTEPTLIKTKKIIAEYGLLEEVNRKNKSNQIYPLEPKTLSDNWNHIEEIKKNRIEKAESDQKRRKGKKQGETRRKSGDLQNESYGELKNLSHGDLKNLSSGDLKNLREIQTKNHKSNLINLNH